MKVLFVCTGNTCRSPLAEAWCNATARNRGRVEASSAGLSATDGTRASENARAVAGERGLSLESFRSRRLSREMLCGADLVLCMGAHHAAMAKRLAPEAAEKIRLLAGDGRDIADPYGGGLGVYRDCMDEITSCVDDFLTERNI